MDIFLLIVAGVLMVIGIIGCIVPGLPGTPIAYAGLWIAQATDRVDFSWQILLIWGIVTIVVSVLDYVVPAWGTKQFGGTKWGVWGSTIGVFAGLFFGAAGVIIGPLAGAILGELIGGKSRRSAQGRLGQFYRNILWNSPQAYLLRSDDRFFDSGDMVI